MDSRRAGTGSRHPVTGVVALALLPCRTLATPPLLAHLLKGQILETRSRQLGAQDGLDKAGLCAGPSASWTACGGVLDCCRPSEHSGWGVSHLRHSIPLTELPVRPVAAHAVLSRDVPWLTATVLSEEVALLQNTGHSCIGSWLLESVNKISCNGRVPPNMLGFVVVWSSSVCQLWVSFNRLVWGDVADKRRCFPVLFMSEWFLKYFTKHYWRFDWRQSLVIKLEERARLKKSSASWLCLF